MSTEREESEDILNMYMSGNYAKVSTANCDGCRRQAGPSHDGSKNCKSGSIASGGTKSHCSCDTCF